MSQNDFDVPNGAGSVVRNDIKSAFQALASLNSGGTAPGTPYANQWWMDTSTNILKQRDNNNATWINAFQKSGTGWVPYLDGVLLGEAVLGSTKVIPKSATYLVVGADRGKLIECTGTFVLDLTAAGDVTIGDGFYFWARNSGSGVIDIDPNSTESINGGTASLKLAPGQTVRVVTDDTAWFATIDVGGIAGLTALTTIDGANDHLALYDNSGADVRKVTPDDLIGGSRLVAKFWVKFDGGPATRSRPTPTKTSTT